MTQIIGFAGKKQSGKSTCCNFLLGLKLHEHGICQNVSINKEGNIIVSDIFGEKVSGVDWIPLTPEYVDVSQLLHNFDPCKVYAFADPLKEFLINVFGIRREQLYGSDNEKNSETHLRWENMPGVITPQDLDYLEFDGKVIADYNLEELGLIKHEPGPMTAREVMQFFGTEVCRKMYGNVWTDTMKRMIKAGGAQLSLISDVRFDNEVHSIKEDNGIIIGLRRDMYSSDHASEQINFDLCDYVIDNQNMSMEEMLRAVYDIVSKIHPFKVKVG